MGKNIVILKEAIKFHGHLGPWLVLGILMGRYALKKIKAKKYFGIKVKIWGATERPKSCLIDGLQLSTGATYGKGNIEKLDGSKIRVAFYNCATSERIFLQPKTNLIKKINEAKTHCAAENLAKRIYRLNPKDLFILSK